MSEIKPVSRQRIWQLKQQQLGLCLTCAKPRVAGSNFHCAEHHTRHIARLRTSYRTKRNIPLDDPIRKTKPTALETEWKTPEFFESLGRVPDNKIASQFGVTTTTVSYHRRKLGIAPHRKHK